MIKKILYICDTGAVRGGGEISFFNLIENLDRNSFQPIVCLPEKGDLSGRLEDLGLRVILFSYRRVSNPANIANTWETIRLFAGIIRKEDIALVHTNSTGGVVVLAGIACWLTKKPLISHIRLICSGFFQDIAQGLLSSRIIIISRRIGRKASFVFFKKKLSLIYNGVDLARFADRKAENDFREDAGIPENALLVGAAGVYVPGKGFEYLIKAVKALKPRIPDLYVVVVGFQPRESERYISGLKNMARKVGLGDTIKFCGRCDDMPAFFRSLDVFVFPSLIDSFGRAMIEAMACAKPVVAFAAGGSPEIVADGITGYLARPRDSKMLAEKIESLLNDKWTAVRFGENALQRCRELFDIKIHAAAVQKLYREILKDGSLGFTQCPICGDSGYTAAISCKITEQDAKISEKILYLCRCRKCGLTFVNPQPQILEENPADLYGQDYFNDYMKFHSVAENGALQSNEAFSLRLSLIQRFKSKGSLLDIGCATGEFLKSSRDAGFSVTGVDISPYACQTARDKYGLDVREGTFEKISFPEHSFDVISIADVLEHTRRPLVFLQEISRILRDDGIIYIAVPDFGSFHYRFMSFCALFTHKNYFVLPHHLYHFTGSTLERLLQKSGFTVLTRVSSESQIRVTGFRRLIMQAIFIAGRIFGAKDRLLVIAGKTQGKKEDR